MCRLTVKFSKLSGDGASSRMSRGSKNSRTRCPRIGGPDIPGVGWAAGVERLSLMVESDFSNKPDVVLLGVSEEYNTSLLYIMKSLVKSGLKVEIFYTGSMSKKFKRANKINASFAIILGEEEIKNKVIKLKNLFSGSEELIRLETAIETIKNFSNN